MDAIWKMVVFAGGIVAFILVLELLSVPEWIETYLKNRKPREELERQLADLQRRVSELEAKTKS